MVVVLITALHLKGSFKRVREIIENRSLFIVALPKNGNPATGHKFPAQ